MKKFLTYSTIVVLSFALSGCASIGRTWKSLVSSSDSDTPPPAQPAAGAQAGGAPGTAGAGQMGANGVPPSFSTQPNYGNYQDRQYKRVTKQNFTDAQMLEEGSGSLWRKEGQGSYLFAQNNLRVMGDIINVEVEGKVSENLNTKVGLIKKAQAKYEILQPAKTVSKSVAKIPRPGGERGVATTTSPKAQSNSANSGDQNKMEDKKDAIKFDPVTCRIIEKNTDGSYRIKGMQMVIIGRKEYKLMVTGNIRPDDITSESIAASKVMDSKFDLVATNRDIEK